MARIFFWENFPLPWQPTEKWFTQRKSLSSCYNVTGLSSVCDTAFYWHCSLEILIDMLGPMGRDMSYRVLHVQYRIPRSRTERNIYTYISCTVGVLKALTTLHRQFQDRNRVAQLYMCTWKAAISYAYVPVRGQAPRGRWTKILFTACLRLML